MERRLEKREREGLEGEGLDGDGQEGEGLEGSAPFVKISRCVLGYFFLTCQWLVLSHKPMDVFI
jgi:hypothetical protein